RPRLVGILRRRLEKISDRVDGELARDLARRVTAHSVGHDVEALFVQNGEVVLVVIPLHADVRFTDDFDAERLGHEGTPLRVEYDFDQTGDGRSCRPGRGSVNKTSQLPLRSLRAWPVPAIASQRMREFAPEERR